MKLRWPHPSTRALIVTSILLTWIALGMFVWSVLAPTPLPVMLAMTIGQGIGSLAFLLFIIVVVRDWRGRT